MVHHETPTEQHKVNPGSESCSWLLPQIYVFSRLFSMFISLALQFHVYINYMIKSKTGTWAECGFC